MEDVGGSLASNDPAVHMLTHGECTTAARVKEEPEPTRADTSDAWQTKVHKTTRPHKFVLYDLADSAHPGAPHVRHKGETKEFRMRLRQVLQSTFPDARNKSSSRLISP